MKLQLKARIRLARAYQISTKREARIHKYVYVLIPCIGAGMLEVADKFSGTFFLQFHFLCFALRYEFRYNNDLLWKLNYR